MPSRGRGACRSTARPRASLGVSGDWTSYTATVTGSVAITLTTDGLTLNGPTLPAGTYTITTTSATLSGSGPSTRPTSRGRHRSPRPAARRARSGDGNGCCRRRVTARPGQRRHARRLHRHHRRHADGNGTDSVTLSGTAGNVLQVSGSPTDVHDRPEHGGDIPHRTSRRASPTPTRSRPTAPPGWTVTIDASGNVTATPAPGLQSGTYPIQIIAQSTTDPDLDGSSDGRGDDHAHAAGDRL